MNRLNYGDGKNALIVEIKLRNQFAYSFKTDQMLHCFTIFLILEQYTAKCESDDMIFILTARYKFPYN
jgi:hypothetical protein